MGLKRTMFCVGRSRTYRTVVVFPAPAFSTIAISLTWTGIPGRPHPNFLELHTERRYRNKTKNGSVLGLKDMACRFHDKKQSRWQTR
ncbi:hypothetical protein P153DRAFT_366044 [Dothidotthia symphoricarpi CBS 119687]|uniref:Uncharacterized protein n=1 Tax=Dothidotthia symphoricarpi CBS 119687 TaxID=1392245 RepID=A0A6A6AF97_9PLEO|nr:uncharacterized protein P153DRAFT_366044 [Dothidotthia symphoricarpi CBS 119687]KAF2130460.1 hypothetical protein P153DRAFT_366044 [Dothidotthia symphoricarpi CBS 119687]